MRELIRTNDPVLISFATSFLRGEGVEVFVFDNNISGVEGYIGIFMKRLLVRDSDYTKAVRLVHEAGLEEQLSRDA